MAWSSTIAASRSHVNGDVSDGDVIATVVMVSMPGTARSVAPQGDGTRPP
jgi:hypothetical protein